MQNLTKKETETEQKLTNNNPLKTMIQIKQKLKKTIHPVFVCDYKSQR